MLQGKFVAVLILLAFPILVISPTVGGQEYVTQTVTTMVTNSQTNTATMESPVTSNSSHAQPIFSASLTLPPTHGVCGTYFVQPFNGTTGALLSGNLTSNNKVDFYVMTNSVFQGWSRQVVAGGNCTPTSVVLSQKGITGYNFTVHIPTDGLYQIVLNNLSTSTVTAHLTVNFRTSELVTVTMMTYSTSTQANVQSLTLITMEQSTTQGNDNTTLMFGALVIVIIIAVALVARARRRKAGKQ